MPDKRPGLYVEPYAGMLGVLLAMSPFRTEMVNDLNSDVVNWWLCIRDMSDDFHRMMHNTPMSREIYEAARDRVRATDEFGLPDMQRASDWMILVWQGFMAGTAGNSRFNVNKFIHRPVVRHSDKIPVLADRMRNVILENRDAVDVIDMVSAKEPDALLYCDPPYAKSGGDMYDVPFAESDLEQVLLTASERGNLVMVSGYAGDFSFEKHGWCLHKMETAGRASPSTLGTTRTEHLWCSFEKQQDIQHTLWEVSNGC